MHQRLTRAENALLQGDASTALRATRGVPDDAIHRTTQATERLWAGDGPRAAHLLASRAPTKPDWSLFHAAASIETFACFPRTNLLDPLAAIHQMRHAIQEDTNATHALEYAARVWPLGIGIAAAHQSVWGDLLYVARSLPVLRNRKARDGIWVNHNTFVCSVPQAIRDEIFNDYHGFPPRDPSTLSAPRQYRHRYLKSLEAHGVEHRQVITDKAVLSTWAILHERHPDEGFDLAMAALESRLERHE